MESKYPIHNNWDHHYEWKIVIKMNGKLKQIDGFKFHGIFGWLRIDKIRLVSLLSLFQCHN